MHAANLRKQPAKAPAAIDLEAEPARIAGMNINELRSLWREREGREAPVGFSKDLIARALALRRPERTARRLIQGGKEAPRQSQCAGRTTVSNKGRLGHRQGICRRPP